MTWQSTSTSGTSSSRASTLFGLDEDDTSKILIYRYRSSADSLEVSSQRDLCRELDADEKLPYVRVTKKKIPRGNSRLEIYLEDVLMPEVVEKYKEKIGTKGSLANVGLPSSAYWKRVMFGAFPELFIVSHSVAPRPESLKNNPLEDSEPTSPSATFPVDAPQP